MKGIIELGPGELRRFGNSDGLLRFWVGAGALLWTQQVVHAHFVGGGTSGLVAVRATLTPTEASP